MELAIWWEHSILPQLTQIPKLWEATMSTGIRHRNSFPTQFHQEYLVGYVFCACLPTLPTQPAVTWERSLPCHSGLLGRLQAKHSSNYSHSCHLSIQEIYVFLVSYPSHLLLSLLKLSIPEITFIIVSYSIIIAIMSFIPSTNYRNWCEFSSNYSNSFKFWF